MCLGWSTSNYTETKRSEESVSPVVPSLYQTQVWDGKEQAEHWPGCRADDGGEAVVGGASSGTQEDGLGGNGRLVVCWSVWQWNWQWK